MSSFAVNPDTLRSLQQSVLALAAGLYNEPELAWSPGRADAYGDPIQAGSLNYGDEAIGDFFSAWSEALNAIGQNMEDVSQKLGDAADEYYTTDSRCMPAEPTII